MRRTALLALFLLALCAPPAALAGTFVVPFNSALPMGAAGWSPKADAGAICGFEGTGTIFLNAGSLPAHSGCFYAFNAPGDAQIVSVVTTYAYSKATAATALCTYSFSTIPGDTLRRCDGGTFVNGIATNGAVWVELGLYNEGSVPIALGTSRANNVVFVSGSVTLADSTPPAVAASGPSGLLSGPSTVLHWQVADGESGAPAASYSIDGGPAVWLRDRACSWLCGTTAGGDAVIDLGGLADGPHSVTVYAMSYADAFASSGPLAFSVDHTAPAQPQLSVAADDAALAGGWWGHAPIVLSAATGTAADVVSTQLRVYAPSGAVVLDQTTAGALRAATVPASALAVSGAYEIDISECDAAGHCAASPRAHLRWDGAPAPVPGDGTAPPLGSLAARDGAHLTWPALAGPAGESGLAGAFVGIGATPAAARAAALAATHVQPGASGLGETAIPAAAIHGATQVCVGTRLVSGAGIAAPTAGVRCAQVDEQAPEIAISGALPWSGGAQTATIAVSDAGGALLSQVLLDGAPVAVSGGAVTISGEGAHVLRAVARDLAGNETVAERSLGVDASPPSIGDISADFIAREVHVGVSDALAGIARVEVRLAGSALETRLSGDGRSAIARVPAGVVLDGAAIGVRALDASSPANASERTAKLASRPQSSLRRLSAARGRISGRLVAGLAARVQLWALPKGREPRLVGSFQPHADGSFALRVHPARTTRYAVAVPATQQFRALAARVAGTLRVTARITALQVAVRGDRLLVRARFAGRGEATRLHLLVHDLRGGRWVEGCLEHGRPGVRLEADGRVRGSCRIPPSARGRAWTYRLVLAAPSSTWPWRTPSSASRSLLLPLR